MDVNGPNYLSAGTLMLDVQPAGQEAVLQFNRFRARSYAAKAAGNA